MQQIRNDSRLEFRYHSFCEDNYGGNNKTMSHYHHLKISEREKILVLRSAGKMFDNPQQRRSEGNRGAIRQLRHKGKPDGARGSLKLEERLQSAIAFKTAQGSRQSPSHRALGPILLLEKQVPSALLLSQIQTKIDRYVLYQHAELVKISKLLLKSNQVITISQKVNFCFLPFFRFPIANTLQQISKYPNFFKFS